MKDDDSGNWLAAQAHRAMIDNGFEPEFSDEVFRQLDEIRSHTDTAAADGVKDLREILWSSIDNRTSRDLDQVEWAERLDNGDIRILVGIADVDRLVAKGSPLDEHARQNTVTVYTENKIFPMLPEELSTDLTSLNKDQERFAMVADM
ncbi:MAG: RNB domain-containing ribonuclease, partial [Pyrinomonadaceae bacterium]